MFSLSHGCHSLLSFLISFWDNNWDGTTGVVQFKKRSRLVCFETSLSKTNMIFSKRRKGYKERERERETLLWLSLRNRETNEGRQIESRNLLGKEERNWRDFLLFVWSGEKMAKTCLRNKDYYASTFGQTNEKRHKTIKSLSLSKKSKTPKILNSIRFRIAGKAGCRQDTRSKVNPNENIYVQRKPGFFSSRKLPPTNSITI